MADIARSRIWIIFILTLLFLIIALILLGDFWWKSQNKNSRNESRGQYVSNNSTSKDGILNTNGSTTEQPHLSLSKNHSYLKFKDEFLGKVLTELSTTSESPLESKFEEILSLPPSFNDSSSDSKLIKLLQISKDVEINRSAEDIKLSKNSGISREIISPDKINLINLIKFIGTSDSTVKIPIWNSTMELTNSTLAGNLLNSNWSRLLDQLQNPTPSMSHSNSVIEKIDEQNNTNCQPNGECIGNNKTMDIKQKCACVRNGKCLQTGCESEYDSHENSKLEQLGGFLLFNQHPLIYRIPFSNFSNPEEIWHVNHQQELEDISVNCLNRKMYFSTCDYQDNGENNPETSTITEISHDCSNSTTFITTTGRIDGISIDWVSNNIFWTNSKQSTIEVANLSTKKQKVLISDIHMSAKNIVVHPGRGKIFWFNGFDFNSMLEWANEDGSHREVFLIVESVNSLVVDWKNDELCWTENRIPSSLKCALIEDRKIRTIVKSHDGIYNLAVSTTDYYWRNLYSEELVIMDKTYKRHSYISLQGTNDITAIIAVEKKCPRLSNACEYENGGCPEEKMCLPNGPKSRTCVCPDNSKELCT